MSRGVAARVQVIRGMAAVAEARRRGGDGGGGVEEGGGGSGGGGGASGGGKEQWEGSDDAMRGAHSETIRSMVRNV